MMQDKPHEKYRSVEHADEFHVDWGTFYERSLEATRALQAEAQCELGVSYGAHPSNSFDIYYPDQFDENTPVLVFFHGGGFREGAPMYYGALSRPYTDAGAVFICAGYRLLPDCPYPDSAKDAIALVRSLSTWLPTKGLSLDRLHLSGHSAGAILAAYVSFRLTSWVEIGLPPSTVRSTILVSGIYDYRGARSNLVPEGTQVDASPICNISTSPAQVLIAFGMPESNRKANRPFEFAVSSLQLAEELAVHGNIPTIVAMPNHTHVQTAMALGDPSGPIVPAICQLLFSD